MINIGDCRFKKTIINAQSPILLNKGAKNEKKVLRNDNVIATYNRL